MPLPRVNPPVVLTDFIRFVQWLDQETAQPRNDYFNESHGTLVKNEHILQDVVPEALSYPEGTSILTWYTDDHLLPNREACHAWLANEVSNYLFFLPLKTF